MGQIFISYSRRDTPIVNRLVSELQKAGQRVWIDRAGIQGGEQWRREIVAAIDSSDLFLLVLSPNSAKSDNVRRELDLAEGANKRVVPVIVESTTIPEEIRYQLVGLQWLDLSSDFDAGLGQLLEVVGGTDRPEPEIPRPTPGAREGNKTVIIAVALAALVIVAAVVVAAVVAFIVLAPSNREMAPITPSRIAEATATTEQPTASGQTEGNVEASATLKAAIDTALAETRQAELKTVGATPPPSLTPTATPLSPTATPTPTPSATPVIPTQTPTSKPPVAPTPEPDLPIDDFEGPSSFLTADFEINRNAGNEGRISLAGVPHVSHGRQALAFEFDIRNSPPNNYIGFDRALPPQDWSAYASLCFWIESDGSNRSLVLQFGESKFKFWKTTSSLSKGTGDYCIALNGPHQINLRAIGYYGVYVEGPPTGQSVIYIDNIRLVH